MGRYYERQVSKHVHDNHLVRTVVHRWEDGWTKYVIIPRELAIKFARRMRAKHRKYSGYTIWMGDPKILAGEYLRPEHYSGPGRSFAHRPCRVRASRRFVVYRQTGGIDV